MVTNNKNKTKSYVVRRYTVDFVEIVQKNVCESVGFLLKVVRQMKWFVMHTRKGLIYYIY